MSAIYEEVTLAWGGIEYTVTPDYRMVQRIEAGGISIIGVWQRLSRGEPQTSLVAQIIAQMLQSAGARTATPDRVYEHLMTSADHEEWGWITQAVGAFFPRARPEGNSEGRPTNGAGLKTAEKMSATSTGESITRSP